MSKRHLLLLLMIGLFVGLPSLAVEAQDKTYYWDRINVDITLLSNSDIEIVETQTFVFTQGSFTFAYRNIPMNRLQSITNVEVWEGQTRYQSGRDAPGTFRVSREGGDTRITWWYPTTANTTRTFTLKYTVVGGLRFYEGGDQLFWKAIFPDRDFAVQDARVTVHLPQTFARTELLVATYGAPAEYDILDGRTVVFTAQNIPPEQELEVRVQFPHGVVQGQPAPWQVREDRLAAYSSTTRPLVDLVAGILGIGATVGGLLAAFLIWFTRGRDHPVSLVADYLATPPAELPPGLVGTLLDERVDMKDIVATLVDLARRGVIRMTETEDKLFFGLMRHRDFVLEWMDNGGKLRPYESRILQGVFGPHRSVKLSELKNKFYKELDAIKNLLYKETVEIGWFDRSPERTRQLYVIAGVAVLMIAIVVAVLAGVALADYTSLAFLPFVGIGLGGVALAVAGIAMPRKTEKGALAAARWNAFRRYLADIERYTNLSEAKDLFDRYLPYAVAFGQEKSWIARFARLDTPAPTWYQPYRPIVLGGGQSGRAISVGGGQGGFNTPTLQGISDGMATSLQGMSDGLTAMLNSAASTLGSSPGSSSGCFSGVGCGGFGCGGGGGGAG